MPNARFTSRSIYSRSRKTFSFRILTVLTPCACSSHVVSSLAIVGAAVELESDALVTYEKIATDIAARPIDNGLMFEPYPERPEDFGHCDFGRPPRSQLLRSAFFGFGADVFGWFRPILFERMVICTEGAFACDAPAAFLRTFGGLREHQH
jgi:hypothetical protein